MILRDFFGDDAAFPFGAGDKAGELELIKVTYSKKAREARFLFSYEKESSALSKEISSMESDSTEIQRMEEALTEMFGIPCLVELENYGAEINSVQEIESPLTDDAFPPSAAWNESSSTLPLFEAPCAPVESEEDADDYYATPIYIEENVAIREEPKESVFGRFGKNDREVELEEVTPDLQKVVTRGRIPANPESIPTKTGGCILKFDLVNRMGGAVSCKAFCKEKEIEFAQSLFSKGNYVSVKGQLQYDNYAKSMLFLVSAGRKEEENLPMDLAKEKRVEVALESQMSLMESTIDVDQLTKRLLPWGHDAVGIADNGSLQAYPLIAKAVKSAAKKATNNEAGEEKELKVLYGYHVKLLQDNHRIFSNPFSQAVPDLPDSFTVFDLETTGFSRYLESIIEIGAVRYEKGEKVGEFSEFVNPNRSIPTRITELTSITDAMVSGAEPIEKILPKFLEFAQGSILVAHNAEFDIGFLRAKAAELSIPFAPVWMDTLGLARCLHPEFKNHKLDTLTKELRVPAFHHHRAIDDATATGYAFLTLWDEWQRLGISFSKINETPSKFPLSRHEDSEIWVYCKDQSGLKDLYELVSEANVHYFDRGRPGIPESVLESHHHALLVASGLIGTQLFRAAAEDLPEDVLRKIGEKADVFFVQPDTFVESALRKELVRDTTHYRRVIQKIIDLGAALNKPVIATGTPSYLDPGDRLARNILVNYQRNHDFDENGRYRLLTTTEMLAAFSWLPKETAYQIVVTASREFAKGFSIVRPVPGQTYSPELEGAAEELRSSSIQRAEEIYGKPLPDLVQKRLDRELHSIISNGYSSLYVIARRLVQKSNSDGYLVGSRGSVGSSFVATMSGITEVNPLVPHYVCPKCQHSEFVEDSSVECGFDLPPKKCPSCGTEMERNGHTIPFEVFLGFNGDKEPDIDLNFAGVYMPTIHKYTEELFGEGKVFRAGTISGVQEKTAYGFIRKYLEQPYITDADRQISEARIRSLQHIMEGTKRTTGQHAGGLMIVPKQMDITDVTPIQYPADDLTSDVRTTHFSYNNLDHCLLKLDELGHTSPTIIRQLEEMTGINPLTIAFNDPETMEIFHSAKSLHALADYSNSEDGSLGIPEFGTNFVRGMLKDTHPTTFGELCRISGLSHGTDVWLNNAQDLIRAGKTDLRHAICTRDDIMTYLISMGMDKLESFKTMEAVRKGKGIPEGTIPHMKEHNVPDWYIESCQKIKYMFPKAHATAYVMMSYRIAWFKVHQPAAFYATYLTQHLSLFSSAFLVSSLEEVQQKMEDLKRAEEAGESVDGKKWALWEIVEEMYARGLRFEKVNLLQSDAAVFRTTPEGNVLPPLAALDDVSEANGEAIKKARGEGEFISRNDLKQRANLNKSCMQSLSDHGLLDAIPMSNQMSFLPGF